MCCACCADVLCPCCAVLQGAKGIYKALKEHLGVDYGQTTPVGARVEGTVAAVVCVVGMEEASADVAWQ